MVVFFFLPFPLSCLERAKSAVFAFRRARQVGGKWGLHRTYLWHTLSRGLWVGWCRWGSLCQIAWRLVPYLRLCFNDLMCPINHPNNVPTNMTTELIVWRSRSVSVIFVYTAWTNLSAILMGCSLLESLVSVSVILVTALGVQGEFPQGVPTMKRARLNSNYLQQARYTPQNCRRPASKLVFSLPPKKENKQVRRWALPRK